MRQFVKSSTKLLQLQGFICRTYLKNDGGVPVDWELLRTPAFLGLHVVLQGCAPEINWGEKITQFTVKVDGAELSKG